MAAVKSITIEESPFGRKLKFQLHDKGGAMDALKEIMAMPTITEPARGRVAKAQGENAEKEYAALLESMRPQA